MLLLSIRLEKLTVCQMYWQKRSWNRNI
ncbi:hypothetical protein MTR67_035539 [Solanum verrucosum]|uniref:Uncharacterized protein n=1 Tax=Solanum verrucosum TaxID=315347 RepID=A0AAF0ZME4_SOLVR|nr:hypothetical protein MTR67_035539 [Solanum verrucosum]